MFTSNFSFVSRDFNLEQLHLLCWLKLTTYAIRNNLIMAVETCMATIIQICSGITRGSAQWELYTPRF